MTTLSAGNTVAGMKSSARRSWRGTKPRFLFYGTAITELLISRTAGHAGKNFRRIRPEIRQHAIGSGCFAPAAANDKRIARADRQPA